RQLTTFLIVKVLLKLLFSIDSTSCFVNRNIIAFDNRFVSGLKTCCAEKFKRTFPDGTELNFEVVQGGLPVILEDNEGTTWNVFGRGISGPRTGEQLESVQQMMGYWFAFPAFNPNIGIK
ncbi:MAG TPA: DUF3179 domain-containing (seleno)protein, partial [Prolixibacteraceae bacterium]|nr:DUF3179 domain-containing (seleno)protein [Prolixibacteraceae bacterium]